MRIGRTAVGIGALAVGLVVGSTCRRAGADGIPDPTALFYGGFLENGGAAVDDPQRSMTVRLWPNPSPQTGEQTLCETVAPSTAVVQGHFRIALDATCKRVMNANNNVWVEVVDGSTSLGRAKIGAMPFAVESDRTMDAIGDLHPKSISMSTRSGLSCPNSAGGMGNLISRNSNDEVVVGEASFTNAMRFQTKDGAFLFEGGNVGIGLGTPVAPLTVQSTANPSGYSEILRLEGRSLSNGWERGISFTGNAGALEVGRLSSFLTNLERHLRFTTGGTLVMTLRENGNVGIGTTTPNNSLHVRRSDGNVLAQFESTLAGGNAWIQASIPGRSYLIGNRGDEAGNFTIFDNTANADRFSINAVGNVGIGTTTPAYTLQVNGSAGKPGGGSWTDSSDVRLKKNVKQLAGAIDRLLQLQGVTFEWKEPARHGNFRGPQIGMIAQEVEQVFPDWVGTDSEGFKTLTFRGFEALTVEALRALRSENQNLEVAVTKLEVRIQRLEDRQCAVSSSVQAGFGTHAERVGWMAAAGFCAFWAFIRRRRDIETIPRLERSLRTAKQGDNRC